MSNITRDDAIGFSSEEEGQENQVHGGNLLATTGDPAPEVIALSPTSLTPTRKFNCEICYKGFQREQNLQLHRRGHNLPWNWRQSERSSTTMIRKRVFVCPEPSCVHHNPARALGDFTGIKKHYSRRHGEKKWKCDQCSKKFPLQSDLKAHQKTCGTREYKCNCGTIFSRAFCDASIEENNNVNQEMLQSQHTNDHMDSRNNGLMGLPDFNNCDPESPTKSIPQELVSMPDDSSTPANANIVSSSL